MTKPKNIIDGSAEDIAYKKRENIRVKDFRENKKQREADEADQQASNLKKEKDRDRKRIARAKPSPGTPSSAMVARPEAAPFQPSPLVERLLKMEEEETRNHGLLAQGLVRSMERGDARKDNLHRLVFEEAQEHYDMRPSQVEDIAAYQESEPESESDDEVKLLIAAPSPKKPPARRKSQVAKKVPTKKKTPSKRRDPVEEQSYESPQATRTSKRIKFSTPATTTPGKSKKPAASSVGTKATRGSARKGKKSTEVAAASSPSPSSKPEGRPPRSARTRRAGRPSQSASSAKKKARTVKEAQAEGFALAQAWDQQQKKKK